MRGKVMNCKSAWKRKVRKANARKDREGQPGNILFFICLYY